MVCEAIEFGFRKVPSVHHIIPFFDCAEAGIDKPHAESNLISLCPGCHSWADGNLYESIPLLSDLVYSCYAFTISQLNTQPTKSVEE
mgnify:CR=1 FL=1